MRVQPSQRVQKLLQVKGELWKSVSLIIMMLDNYQYY